MEITVKVKREHFQKVKKQKRLNHKAVKENTDGKLHVAL